MVTLHTIAANGRETFHGVPVKCQHCGETGTIQITAEPAPGAFTKRTVIERATTDFTQYEGDYLRAVDGDGDTTPLCHLFPNEADGRVGRFEIIVRFTPEEK